MFQEELCDLDIPHHSKLCDHIMEVCKEHLAMLKSDTEVHSSHSWASTAYIIIYL